MAEILATTSAFIEQAGKHLQGGGLVAFPTETVYGLGADARSDVAVEQIYAVKQRPAGNPLIVHVPTPEAAFDIADFSETAQRVARTFWPGPLTIVTKRRADCMLSDTMCAGLDTVAIRVPNHPVARMLLNSAGIPLVAPSANPSGYISPTCAGHVAEQFSDADLLVLDGGACPVGIESTIVDLSGPVPGLLRHGGLTKQRIEAALNSVLTDRTDPVADDKSAAPAPGLLGAHYAPHLPVRLNAREADPAEAFLGFGSVDERAVANLSINGDLDEAAANLYLMLHRFDRAPFKCIAVAPIPETGIGIAINERLSRAASSAGKT